MKLTVMHPIVATKEIKALVDKLPPLFTESGQPIIFEFMRVNRVRILQVWFEDGLKHEGDFGHVRP